MKQYLVTFLNEDKTFDSAIVEACNGIVAEEYFNHLFPERVIIASAVIMSSWDLEADYKFPSISEEMFKRIHTDSDLEDLADELDVPVMTLGFVFCNESARDTACYGCKNIMRKGFYPCNSCSRGRTDNYVPIV